MNIETTIRKNWKLLAVAIGILAISGSLTGLSVFNLFQGSQIGVIGFKAPSLNTQPLGASLSQSQCFSVENDGYIGTSYPAQCAFSWISSSSQSPEIKVKANLPLVYNDIVDVSYSLGNFIPQCTAGNLISSSGNQCTSIIYKNTTGYEVPYAWSIDITVNTNSEPHITLTGFTWVNEILQFTWNNLPSGYQSVNQTAIYAALTGCTISVSGNQHSCSEANNLNAQLQPMNAGSQVQLYSDQNLQTLIGANNPNLPSSNNPFPSSYMTSQPAYFGITASAVGAYTCNLVYTCWPAIHLTGIVDTFLVGSYISGSSNPNTQTQSAPGGAGSTPNINWNALGSYSIVLIAIVVGVAVIALTGGRFWKK